MPPILSASRVLVIAHRGYSKRAPENTLPAFQSALAVPADLVELDYRHTADGVPVALHDETLDRTTNAKRLWSRTNVPLAEKTLAEVQRLDAGSWFEPRYRHARIPRLEDALRVIQSGSTALVERKAGDAQTLVALLKKKGLLENVVVQSFDWRFLAECHQLAPTLTLAALGQKKLTEEHLKSIAKTGARIVGWSDKATTEKTIAAIYQRGWKAWVYTVDDPKRAVALAMSGIDAIITNDPAMIRGALETACATACRSAS